MKSLQTKLKGKKGFTLAELLIVVAIIAVLVAVSVPIFTSKLNEAKESTDLANIRAAKAVAANRLLSTGSDKLAVGTDYYYDAANGKLVTEKTGIKAYGKSTSTDEEIKGKGDKTPEDKIIKITVKSDETGVDFEWEAVTAASN